MARPKPDTARVCWLAVCLGACSAPVAADLGEFEANEVVTTLQRSGVAAEKAPSPMTDGRWNIEVPADDQTYAVGVLARAELPAVRRPGMLAALADEGLVASRRTEQARLLVGIAGELEDTLRSTSGTLSARVHLAVPEKNPLTPNEPPRAPAASVLIRHRAGPVPLERAATQRLVAGAVSGLLPERVTVEYSAAASESDTAPQLARFGPVTTTRRSLPRLRLAMATAALLNIGLVGVIAVLWSQRRKAQQARDSASQELGDRE